MNRDFDSMSRFDAFDPRRPVCIANANFISGMADDHQNGAAAAPQRNPPFVFGQPPQTRSSRSRTGEVEDFNLINGLNSNDGGFTMSTSGSAGLHPHQATQCPPDGKRPTVPSTKAKKPPKVSSTVEAELPAWDHVLCEATSKMWFTILYFLATVYSTILAVVGKVLIVVCTIVKMVFETVLGGFLDSFNTILEQETKSFMKGLIDLQNRIWRHVGNVFSTLFAAATTVVDGLDFLNAQCNILIEWVGGKLQSRQTETAPGQGAVDPRGDGQHLNIDTPSSIDLVSDQEITEPVATGRTANLASLLKFMATNDERKCPHGVGPLKNSTGDKYILKHQIMVDCEEFEKLPREDLSATPFIKGLMYIFHDKDELMEMSICGTQRGQTKTVFPALLREAIVDVTTVYYKINHDDIICRIRTLLSNAARSASDDD